MSEATQATPTPRSHAIRERAVLQVGLALGLAVLVALVLPFASALVLAAWLAGALRAPLARLSHGIGGRRRGAAVLILIFFVALFGPAVAIVAVLGLDAVELGQGLARSASGREALAQLVSSHEPGGAITLDPTVLMSLLEQHGARALELAASVAGIGAELVLAVFVFFTAAYVLLVDGPLAWAWTIEHAPVSAAALERLRAAFHETGRGLFVGIGLTGLVQAGIATGTYLALGVPRAFVLGLLTLIASIFPTVGTALVWLPVCVALALSGRTTAAIILAVVGVVVVSSIDNVLRPLLTRTGHLALHSFVVLIAMLGGLSLLGPAGLFLGPLFARLAVEMVRIARDAGLTARGLTPITLRPDATPGAAKSDVVE